MLRLLNLLSLHETFNLVPPDLFGCGQTLAIESLQTILYYETSHVQIIT